MQPIFTFGGTHVRNSNRKRTIKLAFLYPGPDDPFINRLVASVSKNPVCHVELVFEDDMSLSIFKGSSLFFKKRTFSNPEYKLVAINISETQYITAYEFCKSCIQENIEFTDMGMIGACLQPKNCAICCYQPSSVTRTTFCSKIITEALQFAGVREVSHLNPCTTTPSMLLDAVSASDDCVCDTSQYRRQLLYNSDVVFVNKLTGRL